jgi:putative RNA 2'-phosphotransferase
MSKKSQIRVDNLSRLMLYILGHRPDEFGLVPDQDGFVPFKELIWALHEEAGWGHVRQGNISEVLLGKDRHLFQTKENRIRAVARQWHQDLHIPVSDLPKLLFLPIRRKAHGHAMEKGLKSMGNHFLVLTPDRDMGMRIGRRRDQKPILLEVSGTASLQEGHLFQAFGELFLTREVSEKAILGPPVSKEDQKPPTMESKRRTKPEQPWEAGSFPLDMTRDPDRQRGQKGKKRKGWKEEARKIRKRRRPGG